jgi:galactokinase
MNKAPPETDPSEIAKEYDHVLLSHDRLDEFMEALSEEEMKQLTIFTEDEHTKSRSKYNLIGTVENEDGELEYGVATQIHNLS